MRTEVPFTLPQGYADAAGKVHREGVMRLATARDEIEPLRDAAVRVNGAYLSVLLLARTVTRLGDFAGEQFMQWFIKEQVEEVSSMNDLLAVVERSRENPMIVEEYLARERAGGPGADPTAPTAAGGTL